MRFIELRATGSTLALTAKTFVSMFRTAVNHGTSFLSMGRPRAQLLIVFIFGGKRWGGRTRGIIEPFVTEMRRAEVVGPPAFICIAKVCKDVGRLPFWAVDVKLAAPSVTHPLTNWLHLEKTGATCSTKRMNVMKNCFLLSVGRRGGDSFVSTILFGRSGGVNSCRNKVTYYV